MKRSRSTTEATTSGQRRLDHFFSFSAKKQADGAPSPAPTMPGEGSGTTSGVQDRGKQRRPGNRNEKKPKLADLGSTPGTDSSDSPGNSSGSGGTPLSVNAVAASSATSSSQADVAASFYSTSMYTDLVDQMMHTVMDGEQFLFRDDDLARMQQYLTMDADSKHLLVRLWMRPRKWIRVDKLDYSKNIQDIVAAAATLVALDLAHDQDNLDWDDALALASVDELKDITTTLHCIVGQNKIRADYVQALTDARKQRAMTPVDHFGIVKKAIGQCILVDEAAFKMFQRVSIVFFRQRDPTQSNELQSAILSKINRRRYPDYVYCRSTDVWPTIDALDQYIDAFWLQQNFEQLVEATTMERRYYKTENTKEMDPALRARWLECWKLCENVIGVWDDLLLAYDMQPQRDNERPYFMRRFEAGYLYTHMIEHGSKILGRLHEYELEATILRKLLEQRRYRNGKRGKWYDRLALIQSTHLKEPAVRPRKKMALQTCIDGVQDPRVHQIHMYSLHRRIHKLERDLCVPKREQHDFSYMALQKPSERVIYGERLTDPKIGSKSVWRSDNGAEISVEEVAIEYYQKQGYKGLHTENGVISMLYTLLFWDIIFAPIPGAFETPYQTAPLDLESDAFYVERVSLIHDRVELVSQNLQAALDLIKAHDDQNRPLNTMCTGVNWNYALQDLLEIAECIGAHSLSCLSSLLAEEYGHRRGGMPDLCCWDYENKKCLFAEIKGPSDTLSETQKMWLHTLSNMGIPVEVCHVAVWKGEDVLDEGN